jgi:hypothetical protein
VLADDHVASGAEERIDRTLEIIAFHLVDRPVAVPRFDALRLGVRYPVAGGGREPGHRQNIAEMGVAIPHVLGVVVLWTRHVGEDDQKGFGRGQLVVAAGVD